MWWCHCRDVAHPRRAAELRDCRGYFHAGTSQKVAVHGYFARPSNRGRTRWCADALKQAGALVGPLLQRSRRSSRRIAVFAGLSEAAIARPFLRAARARAAHEPPDVLPLPGHLAADFCWDRWIALSRALLRCRARGRQGIGWSRLRQSTPLLTGFTR